MRISPSESSTSARVKNQRETFQFVRILEDLCVHVRREVDFPLLWAPWRQEKGGGGGAKLTDTEW